MEGLKELLKILKCQICSYEWIAKVPQPTKCPNCQSRHWASGRPRAPETTVSTRDEDVASLLRQILTQLTPAPRQISLLENDSEQNPLTPDNEEAHDEPEINDKENETP